MFYSNYKTLLYTIIIILFLFCNSCARMYGIKKYQMLPYKTVQKINKHWGIPNSSFVLSRIDSSQITKRKEFISNSDLYKNLHQPSQIAFLNSKNDSISLIVNCDIGGFPNLKWKSLLDQDHSKLLSQYRYPIKTKDYLQTCLSYEISDSILLNTIKNPNTVLVKYSIFMGRQSKRLIKYLKQSDQFSHYSIIFVNDYY
jgi:hypothetical protein